MNLFLQGYIVRRFRAVSGSPMALAVAAGLVDHHAVGIGRLQKLSALRAMAGTPHIAAGGGKLGQIAPPNLIGNRRSQSRIVVAAGAAPQMHLNAVEVREVRIPSDGADA